MSATPGMRIAVWHNLPSGGGRRLLAHHLDHLQRQGHEIRVWTTPQGLLDAPALDAPTVVEPLPLRIRTTRSWSPLPPWFVVRDRLQAMDRHLDAVAHDMDAWAPDVVFANACRLLRATDLGSRVGAPAVLYLGEPYRWLYEAGLASSVRPAGMRRLASGLDRRAWAAQSVAEVRAAAGYDRILVNSRYSRESVQRAYGLDAHVCYPGVDTELFVPGRRGETPYVISVGAFVPEKRPELVIEAVSGLERGLPLRWIANVADGTTLAAARGLAARLGVDLQVEVGVSDECLRSELQGALAMLYAPRLEPFGLAPLEAAACGTPVVALAEAGVRESVTDGVTGVLCDDVRELTRALDSMTTDVDLRNRLSRTGREHVERAWNLRDAGRRLELQLRQAVGRPA
jgi:glycosyltransferase involved in cell wall biosynthesis